MTNANNYLNDIKPLGGYMVKKDRNGNVNVERDNRTPAQMLDDIIIRYHLTQKLIKNKGDLTKVNEEE